MIPLVGRASAGVAHLNFYRKVCRHIGRPMFVDLLVYLISNRDRVVSNDGCSSPFFRLFTRGRKRTQIFHIKSQASSLTSREILFFAMILHSD
jgi:hypothetical protein